MLNHLKKYEVHCFGSRTRGHWYTYSPTEEKAIAHYRERHAIPLDQFVWAEEVEEQASEEEEYYTDLRGKKHYASDYGA